MPTPPRLAGDRCYRPADQSQELSRLGGQAVFVGPNGWSRFDELRQRAAARTATLHAFNLVEHDGKDLRNCAVLIARTRWRNCCAAPGIPPNENIAEDGPIVFEHVR